MSISKSSFDIDDQAKHIEPLDALEPGMAPDFEPNAMEMRFVADALVWALVATVEKSISVDTRIPFPWAESVGVFVHRVFPFIVGRSSAVRPCIYYRPGWRRCPAIYR